MESCQDNKGVGFLFHHFGRLRSTNDKCKRQPVLLNAHERKEIVSIAYEEPRGIFGSPI